MARQILSGFVATNGPLTGYPDFRVPDEVLYALADALNDGSLPFLLDHDPTKPVDGARLLSAEIRPVTSGGGTLGVWTEYEVDEHALGERRAFSVKFGLFGRTFPADEASGTIRLAADAFYFDEAELYATAKDLSALATVETERIYRLHAIPPEAAIVVQVGLEFLYAVGADLFISKLKHLIHRDRQTQITMEVKRPDGVSISADIRTDDPEVAGQALGLLADTVKSATSERLEYDKIASWCDAELPASEAEIGSGSQRDDEGLAVSRAADQTKH